MKHKEKDEKKEKKLKNTRTDLQSKLKAYEKKCIKILHFKTKR